MKKIISLIAAAAVVISCFTAGFIPASAAAKKAGDVNGDGKVNSTDALYILMIVAGSKKADADTLETGDIDGNKTVNSNDALMILQYSARIEFKVQKVSIDKKDTVCKKGESFTVKGKAYPLFAGNTKIKWSSSDESVATVDKDGKVNVVGNGVCKITCTSDENKKVSASFQISSGIKATSVSLNKKSDSVSIGKVIELKATVKPADAYSKKFSWKSSDSSIASVDENGKVKAKSMGTATITCQTIDGSNKTASYKITVNMMKVPYQNQMPSYPTGCEAASCVMLLKAYGYKITIDEMVKIIPRENLKLVNGKWYGPDIHEKFVGDPRGGYRSGTRGYGAFSPVITKSLQKAIDQRGGGCTATDITGCSFDTLLKTVSDGHPTIAWATYNMQNPTDVNAWYIKKGDKETYFSYPKGTHVMVICGYDKNNIYVMDPYECSTPKQFSRSTFEKRWNLLGKQAVILVKNK